jgi:hypothetical protein
MIRLGEGHIIELEMKIVWELRKKSQILITVIWLKICCYVGGSATLEICGGCNL